MESTTVDKPAKTANKGGRPPKKVDISSVLQRPDVVAVINQSVSVAVAAATAAIMQNLGTQRQESGTTSSANEDKAWATKLATEIVSTANPGKKMISPEVLEKRTIANARMETLLISARAEGRIPEYELIAAVYLEERLVFPFYQDSNNLQRKTRIEWPLAPNEAMVPMNEIARDIFNAYMESIGGRTTEGVRPMTESRTAAGSLNVLHEGALRTVPQVGRPRGELRLVGEGQVGAVVETNILGTVAAPARQLA